MMKLEFLPNEMLIECLKYLNALDIFYSFDQLNNRFNNLIRNIELYLNFENIRKSKFDRFCTKMLMDTKIQQQIYSLHLANRNTGGQIEIFLSYFSLQEFSNLRSLKLTDVEEGDVFKLKSILPSIPHLCSCHLIYSGEEKDQLLSTLPMSKLRALSIQDMEFYLTSTSQMSSITKLTVEYCCLDTLNDLFKYLPLLKYFHIRSLHLNKQTNNISYITNQNQAVLLKQLIIDKCGCQFDDLKKLLQQTPNLKSLKIISSNSNQSLIDADEWENLITSSLFYLNIFMFKFHVYYNNQKHNDIITMFKQFHNHFWQVEHHWDTMYVLDGSFAQIFTIPYCSDTYEFMCYIDSYSNKSVNNLDIYSKVTNLTLYDNFSITKYPYYFSNVTTLKLNKSFPPLDLNDPLFIKQNIEYLKKIVNLSQIQHLVFYNYTINPSILLEILKETPLVSEMTVTPINITLFFDNDELCKYLNKMIKILHINNFHGWKDFTSDDMEKFYEIFSNVQVLDCQYNHLEFWLSLINNLSRFLVINIYNIPKVTVYRQNFFSRLQNEAMKRNLIYQIILPIPRRYVADTATRLTIWSDE